MKFKTFRKYSFTLKKSIIWLQIYELYLFHHITPRESQLCVSQHQAAR